MAEEKLKVLHVLDSLAVGGMERVVIDVVNGLNAGDSVMPFAVCRVWARRHGRCAKMWLVTIWAKALRAIC